MCCCIVPDIDGTIITTVDTCWIAPSETSYDIKFLMYQLASPSFQSAVLLKATGTTRKRISKNNLIDLHLLLPPLAEQRRIVHTIEALFAQIDKISNRFHKDLNRSRYEGGFGFYQVTILSTSACCSLAVRRR